MQRTNCRIIAIAICCLIAINVEVVAKLPAYIVCVSNEKSGDVTVIKDGKSVATIPVGKRPRGIHASPDGSSLFVALSGSPITGPPALDGKGNPILKSDDDEDADHSADGIGVVHLRTLRFLRKLPAGSDPEEFAVSKDGKTLYISNEDVATASVVDVGSGKVAAHCPGEERA